MAKRLLAFSFLTVLLCGVGGCPEGGLPTPGVAPTAGTWVKFSITPGLVREITGSGTLRYQIRVDDKAILNAGVEFEVTSVPGGLTANVVPTRLAETGRDAELVVVVPPGATPGDYTVTVRARLTASGQGAPEWATDIRVIEVRTGESGFSIFCEPAELTILAGATATLTCRVDRDSAFTSPVDLLFAPHPEFLTMIPETARVDTSVGGFAFTVSRSSQIIPPPTYSLKVIGRSAGLEREFIVLVRMPSAVPEPEP